MQLRDAREDEVDRLAGIWYDGWQDAHEAILPKELARLRTLESFRERLLARLATTRVVEIEGGVVGFCTLNGDELYQLFVTASTRGSGAAAALVADAEKRLAATGIETAWLGCAIGNDRAARFYEKCGWRRVGVAVVEVETSQGPFDLELWRYEKPLDRNGHG